MNARYLRKSSIPRSLVKNATTTLIRFAWLSILIGIGGNWEDAPAGDERDTESSSTYRIVKRDNKPGESCLLEVAISGRQKERRVKRLPCRVQIKGSDGAFCDGGGRGLYSDGRFFVAGNFRVDVPAGETEITIAAGPNYDPLRFRLDFEPSESIVVDVELVEWFAPESLGWFAGDHHVHAQHDRQAEIQTSLEYAALQARANGLSFVTEAGSNVDYAELNALSTDDFQIRRAGEIRPGPFVGHLNTPGLHEPLPSSRLDQALRQPLPAQSLRTLVEQAGGLTIHTHPLTPRHQIHWMGAAEYYSDIVSGMPAHAFDVDSRAADWLYFAGLNLGNRIAVSSYTDCALGRRSTPSPGDRRVYVWLDPDSRTPVSYDSMVASFRSGKSIATNGGPLFACWSVHASGPGDVIDLDTISGDTVARLEIHHRFPLTHVEIYRRGRRIHAIDARESPTHDVRQVTLPNDWSDGDWLVLRVQDEQGHWCLSSPIYFSGETPTSAAESRDSSSIALLFQISNSTRFIELRTRFFAHVIATVDRGRELAEITVLRDGEPLQSLWPEEGQRLGQNRKLPVTEIHDEYQTGWVWFPDHAQPFHCQADLPITETGWYAIEVRTTDGRTLRSKEMYFDRDSPVSHQSSQVLLEGPDTRLMLLGYSEEMPLEEIEIPFEGDHWWYPLNILSLLQIELCGETQRQQSGRAEELQAHFHVEIDE